MRFPRLRKALRYTGIVLASILALVVVLLVTGALVVRSHWGERKLLAIGLPAANKVLLGHLDIGGLDGDLFHRLVVRDIVLYDSERELIARVGSVELRYNLLALVHKNVHLTMVKIDDAHLRVRFFRDGRLNLTTLIKPTPPSGKPLPVTITLADADVDLNATVDADKQKGIPATNVQIKLAASANIVDPKFSVELKSLKIHASDPLIADVDLQGGVYVVNGDKLQVNTRDLALAVRTTGEQVNRYVPAAELLGSWELGLTFRGALASLLVEGSLHLPKGLINLRGLVGVLDPARPWEFQLQGQGIDPALARVGIPAALIDLQLAGKGQDTDGRVELGMLKVSAYGASVNASGYVKGNARQEKFYPLPTGIDAQLALHFDAPDVAAVARPFAPATLKLGGSVNGQATALVEHGKLHLSVNVGGKQLKAAGNEVGTLKLAMQSVDLDGKVQLQAEKMHTPLPFDRLALNVGMNEKDLSIHAFGQSGQNPAFEVAVAGQPHLRGRQELLGIDANLKQLYVVHAGQRLQLRAPAHLAVDLKHPDGPIIDLDRLALQFGTQQVTLGGHFEAKTERFRASLDTLALNAKQWAQLVGAGAQVPQTWLNIHAQAAGTPKAPEGRVQINGSVAPLPAQHLPRSDIQATVTMHNQRAHGEVALQLGPAALGNDRPHMTLKVDAPLSTTGAVSLDLEAQSLAQAWQDALPGMAGSLRGQLTLHTTLRGTLQHPELALKLDVPSWQLAQLRGRGTTLAVNYARDQLSVGMDAQVAPQQNAKFATATVKAQTHLHLGMGPGMTAPELERQALHGVMSVDAKVADIDLPKVLAALSPDTQPPLQNGMFGATLNVTGTPAAPTVKLKVDGKDIAAQGIKNVALDTSVDYAGSEVRVALNAGLPNQPLITAKASTTLPMAHVLSGSIQPKQLPVRASVTVLPIELSQFSPVKGAVSAQVEAHGTVAAPEVTAVVRSDSLQLDQTQIGPLTINASLDHNYLVKALVDAKQKDGSLHLSASTLVPPKPESVQVQLQAKNFRVHYEPRPDSYPITDAVGMARGILNADLQVQGGAAGPKVKGSLKLEQGGLIARAIEQTFTDIYLDLQVAPEGQKNSILTLRELRLGSDAGKVKVAGTVQLDGMQLGDFWMNVDAQKFPVLAGPIGLAIDSKIAAHGHSQGDTLTVDVDIKNGTVRLPKLESARSIQPLGPFEDVKLVDRAAVATAERVKAEKAKEEQKKAAAPKSLAFLPSHTKVSVKLPDAFHVTGPEVHADLTGNINMTLDPGGTPRIVGEVRSVAAWGFVELLGHRYDLDNAQVNLSGEYPPNPLLNISIERKLDDATVFIMVNGTAARPKITFRSDPPIYDQSQVIAIILTGESGTGGGKGPQAMGMLSSLVIGQLRNQLADHLPVDVIRVDVSGDDPMGVGQTSLEFGKFIREDLYLGYKRRFGSATTGMQRLNADEALLEYHFLKHLKLRTLYGDANVGAVDLYWTKRY